MGLLANLLFSVIAAAASVFAIYNYAPLSLIQPTDAPKYGAAITTINGTDTLSSSRSVINTNFANLNASKIEATQTTLNSLTSASSLATVGTITAGTWTATPVGVAYGGTGTTSPTSNQVFLGNGASGFKVIGFGTSGQFLTSGGNGSAPSWTTSALDPSLDYNWTGTTRLKTLIASSTITFSQGGAGASYTFPTSHGANTTVLAENGSGTLSWNTAHAVYSAYNISGASVANGYSTSTIVTIPAGVLTASSTIEVVGQTSCQDTNSTGGTCTFYLRDSTGAPFGSFNYPSRTLTTNGSDPSGMFTITVLPNNSASVQQTMYTCAAPGIQDGATGGGLIGCLSGGNAGTSAINLANATTFVFVMRSSSANATASFNGLSVIIHQ